MAVFPKEKMDVIKAVAIKAGLPESPDKGKEGVFYDPTSSLIIDTRLKSEYFSGLPVIGIYDKQHFTIEEHASETCISIRKDITDGFAKLSKYQQTRQSKTILKPEPPNDPDKGQEGIMMSGEITTQDTRSGLRPLSIQDIQKYICPKASESEAYMFLQLCINRGLNPFLKEAHLVKYGDSPATMIVGKDAFTRKAEESGKLDGYEAGIIVKTNTDPATTEERVGTILYEKEFLLGGWARVYRKDMSKPFEVKVGLNEYKKQNNWLTMPATMIRKVALVQSLREAFTKELSGCYDSTEVGDGN